MQAIIKTHTSSLEIEKGWISGEKLEILFEKCKKLKLEKNPKIFVFGKEATMHRSVGFFQ